jgi:thiamine pyrophosphate-dependent acetolactate synthase large subunit-like protein
VPVLMIAGNDRGDIPSHTAADMAGLCRSFTKWDAQPKTLDEALVAIQRAYNEAITPPMAPTLVVMDSELQKMNAPMAKIPAYKPPQYTTVDSSRVKEIAKGLVDAQNPRIAVGRLRTPQGVKLAIELAELVGASTATAAARGPMSFPQRHSLCGPGASTAYDYTLGLETGCAEGFHQYWIWGPGWQGR